MSAPQFLLDTNTLSYFLRGEGRVAQQMFSRKPGELAISSLSHFELRRGALKAKWSTARWGALQKALSALSMLPFDAACAESSAQIAAALEAQGRPIGPIDTLIAGAALANGLTLVTRNLDEFKRVKGLTVLDWY